MYSVHTESADLGPVFYASRGLKVAEYDECTLANPNRCKVKNWADARRLSPRWNHYHWRDLSLIMYSLGIAGWVGFGGRFLRLGTSLPSSACPPLQGRPASKRSCWNQTMAMKGIFKGESKVAKAQEIDGESGSEDGE